MKTIKQFSSAHSHTKQPIAIVILGLLLLPMSPALVMATTPNAAPNAAQSQPNRLFLSLRQGSEQVDPELQRVQPRGLSPSPSRRVNPGVQRVKPSSMPTPPPPTPTNPPAQSYRVKMWFAIENANDGAFDNTIECYGELRIDGDLYWQSPREASSGNQRERGQTLEVSNSQYTLRQFVFNKPAIMYSLWLKDADSGSSDDAVYEQNGAYGSLAFEEIIKQGGEKIIFYQNSKTFESSKLLIRVERIQ